MVFVIRIFIRIMIVLAYFAESKRRFYDALKEIFMIF